MKRLNKKRQIDLEPNRMITALKEIENLGYLPYIPNGNPHVIAFIFKEQNVSYFPYTGWASGKSIKDGRGLKNLLKQIKCP